MYRILEMYHLNPRLNAVDAVRKFEEEFQVEENMKILKGEAATAMNIRRQLRPLYGQRMEVEEKMKYLLSDMEMEIYLEFPPRKGSDIQREAMRNELKKKNVEYTELQAQFRALTLQIDEVDDQNKDLEIKVKAARRLLETFNTYINFITEFSKGRNN